MRRKNLKKISQILKLNISFYNKKSHTFKCQYFWGTLYKIFFFSFYSLTYLIINIYYISVRNRNFLVNNGTIIFLLLCFFNFIIIINQLL